MATPGIGKRKFKIDFYFDYSLLFIVLFLVGFGLIMIYSASSYAAQEDFGDASHYLVSQAKAAVLGLILMIIIGYIPYHFWERFAILGYGLSIVLIPLVLTSLGVESHGARRWIRLPVGGFNMQPAELVKVAIILLFASLIGKMGKNVSKLKSAIMLFVIIAVPCVMIYAITNNFSSAVIVFLIGCAMYIVANPNNKVVLILILLGVLGIVTFVFLVFQTDIITGFRAARILAWKDPESQAQGVGFQTIQALYAIGSGGIFGKGLGQSMQKLSFLPESQNDMIFSIICEELGIFGAVAVIVLFIILLWRMMIVANNAPDLFGSLLVIGVMAHIGLQAILNIAVVTNVMPNTGISLPFISYGGSSILFLLSEVGLVLNVARSIELKEA